jgi:UDP:flavonoid glycosyltransferase YjiC (YdhE family)
VATILFVTIEAGGNTPPALAIAAELGARGHRILFLGHAQQRHRITEAGFEFQAFRSQRPWNRSERSSSARVVSDFVYAATSRQFAQDFLDTARDERVDLTVTDCMLLSVAQAAASLPAPTAVLFHTFYAYWSGGWRRGPVGRIARLRGLNARAIWAGADLELIAGDPALDPGSTSATSHRVWTGITETGAPASPAAKARPRVLVSLSTTWFPGQVDVYRRIVAALASIPADAIVTTGGMVSGDDLAPPSNVTVVDFADHAALLPTVDLVVSHGGHSTAMKAVANGVPCLIIPMHPLMDQPMVGAAIRDAGLGLILPKRSGSSAIRSGIVSLLDDSRFRIAAVAAADRQRDLGRSKTAADTLEQLLEGGLSASRR